jgi:hypothetical protein
MGITTVADTIFCVVPPKLKSTRSLVLAIPYRQDAARTKYLFNLSPIYDVYLSHFLSLSRPTSALVNKNEALPSVRALSNAQSQTGVSW